MFFLSFFSPPCSLLFLADVYNANCLEVWEEAELLKSTCKLLFLLLIKCHDQGKQLGKHDFGENAKSTCSEKYSWRRRQALLSCTKTLKVSRGFTICSSSFTTLQTASQQQRKRLTFTHPLLPDPFPCTKERNQGQKSSLEEFIYQADDCYSATLPITSNLGWVTWCMHKPNTSIKDLLVKTKLKLEKPFVSRWLKTSFQYFVVKKKGFESLA